MTEADGIPVNCAFTELRTTAALKPHPRNPNHHPEEQIEIFAKVVRHLGWRAPIVVSKRSGFVVKGHGKLLVAKRLGVAQVPVDLQAYASEEEEWEDLLADNRIAELSERDDSEIARLIEELSARSAEIELTGYDAAEVAAILTRLARSNPEIESEPDLEHAEELRKRWGTELGQIWALGPHRLLCADCTQISAVKRLWAALPPNVAPPRLMVTDPPYGVNYDPDWRNRADRANGKPYGGRALGRVSNDDHVDWQKAWQAFPGDVAYVWHAGRFCSVVQNSLEAEGFEIRAQIIWAKTVFVISRGNYHWQHEPCWYAVRKDRKAGWTGQRDQSTLWQIEHRKSETGHSTQKPIECMRRPIENNSQLGESIYDPFLGSGTTLIACEQTGRVCLGIEIDPAYVAVALQRWADLTHSQPILLQK